MAAVFRELNLSWNGKEVRIKPTMRLLNEIEQDVSLSRVAYRLASGDPPLSQLAIVIGHFLRAGGVGNVTDEDVYCEIMQGSKEQITEMSNAIMMAAFPQAGKPEAPATKAKPKAKKAPTGGSRKRSAGATTSRSGAGTGS